MEHTPSFRDQLQNGSEPNWRDDLSDELQHHGIKGMHWGVRRPRNEDGIIQGAGASLAKKQKKLRAKAADNKSTGQFSRNMANDIQRDADAHGAKARSTRNVIKKVGHRAAQLWDMNAAETWRGTARHFEKKAAKQTFKADRLKAKEDFAKFNRDARRKAEKNIDYENSGRYDRELDAAINKDSQTKRQRNVINRLLMLTRLLDLSVSVLMHIELLDEIVLCANTLRSRMLLLELLWFQLLLRLLHRKPIISIELIKLNVVLIA